MAAFALAGIPASALAHEDAAQGDRSDSGRPIDLPRAFPTAGKPAPALLRLSTRSALPGTRVRMRGRRFDRRRTALIAFGGRRLRLVRTNRRGGLRAAVRVPRRTPGVYTLSARTGRRLARVRFRIPVPPSEPSPTATPAQAPQPQPQPQPPASDPVTLVAAGDIACAPGDPNASATRCRHAGTADRVLALAPDVVALLGDIQYETATAAEFLAPGAYNDTWGRFKSVTRPAVGNHEYQGDPERDSAVGYYGYFGAAAGDPAKGYYAYDIGDWRAVVLNTGALESTLPGGVNSTEPDDCFPVSCSATSEQVTWLRSELASLPPDKCVVAYWHHPRYDSLTRYSYDELIPIYDALYDGGAELALTGHDHSYERFAPMTADNTVDASFGVRQFIVGIGGKDRRFVNPDAPAPGSEFRESNTPVALYGVLELQLSATGYEYRLVGENGEIRDQGSAQCHGRATP